MIVSNKLFKRNDESGEARSRRRILNATARHEIETDSSIDIKKAGAYKYAQSPAFEWYCHNRFF
ncbi:hypothetical protein DX130_00945 [Paenibacillus paeoniae]|uniref:Uncharacterized protein n=1 Tax=Paenibacillus paeoniae TaxID=2292705 RepID=A0A371PHG8_9BACL|nr:hypothetical protein DX130_00945 [Paenibacillus paeoniae]